jgi:plastocyanin
MTMQYRYALGLVPALALAAACGSGSSSGSASGAASGAASGQVSEPVVPSGSVERVACAGRTPQHEIAMQNLAFTPAALTIAPGDTVRWTNRDNVPHTVTSGTGPAASDAGALADSGALASGATVCYEFKRAGAFPYFCRIHGAAMTGSLTVGSASPSGNTGRNPGGNTGGGTGGY